MEPKQYRLLPQGAIVTYLGLPVRVKAHDGRIVLEARNDLELAQLSEREIGATWEIQNAIDRAHFAK